MVFQNIINKKKKGNNKIAKTYSDGSDNLLIRHNLAISVYHIPTDSEVSFKAMITDHGESYASSWQEEDVYGRADSIVNFKSTKRSISLAWKTVGSTEDEVRANMGSVGLLTSMLYPTYDVRDFKLGAPQLFSSATVSAAPVVRLKFSNLIANSLFTMQSNYTAKRNGQMGIIRNLSIKPDAEVGYIQLSRGGLMPKSFDVSIDFLVIHEHPVGWGTATGAGMRFFTAQEDGNPSQFPFGATHVEKDTSKFEKDQRSDNFKSPKNYRRQRPVEENEDDWLNIDAYEARRKGPERSLQAVVNKALGNS